jgi:type IV pilus assembly protein PilQ
MWRALSIVAIFAADASADRDLCGPSARHHGAPIDLDLKRADVRDVLRLLADVGHANLVASDDVEGKVTLRLKRVPWDAALCTVAAVEHLAVTFEDNILVVRRAR